MISFRILCFCQKWLDQLLWNVRFQSSIFQSNSWAFQRIKEVLIIHTLALPLRVRPLSYKLTAYRNPHVLLLHRLLCIHLSLYTWPLNQFLSTYCLTMFVHYLRLSNPTGRSTNVLTSYHRSCFSGVFLDKDCWRWVVKIILDPKRQILADNCCWPHLVNEIFLFLFDFVTLSCLLNFLFNSLFKSWIVWFEQRSGLLLLIKLFFKLLLLLLHRLNV